MRGTASAPSSTCGARSEQRTRWPETSSVWRQGRAPCRCVNERSLSPSLSLARAFSLLFRCCTPRPLGPPLFRYAASPFGWLTGFARDLDGEERNREAPARALRLDAAEGSFGRTPPRRGFAAEANRGGHATWRGNGFLGGVRRKDVVEFQPSGGVRYSINCKRLNVERVDAAN